MIIHFLEQEKVPSPVGGKVKVGMEMEMEVRWR